MGGLPFGTPQPPIQPWQPPAPQPVAGAVAGGGAMPVPGQPPMPPETTSPEPDSTIVTDVSPTKRRRSLNVDPDKACSTVMDRVGKARDERVDWMTQRLVRYAKLRGWRQAQSWPWEGAHNEHVPLMMSNKLRIDAGLFNAVMGNKPMMQGRALRRDKMDQADKAANLIEFQLMQEANGEQVIAQAVDQFTADGTIISFQPWVKDSRRMVDVRVISGPDGNDLSMYMLSTLPQIIPGLTKLQDEKLDGYHWIGEWQDQDGDPQEVEVEVWDRDDGKLEVEMRWDSTTFDGPTCIVHQLEDIVVPLRSLNTQPVTPQNPYGAPWIARRLKVNLDTIHRRMKNGTYDLLSDTAPDGEKSDWDKIVAWAETREAPDMREQEDAVKIEKEYQAGLSVDWSAIPEDKTWLDLVEWYGSYDIDGYECEVVFHILDVPGGILCRARYLSEVCPGSPQWRPFAEERFIPVSDSFYGISLPEVLEGLHDLLHELFNANLDRGDIANLPVMLYRASSGIKPEQMSVRPGDWVPVDNPKEDAVPVQYPHADQSWSFDMIGLVQQLAERVIQVGSLQFGQVPQGKASALRTVGTTMAILQQGAALPEQILRRYFHWLQQVYGQFHMLNTKFLPPKKRYLIAGKDPDTDAAYAEVGPQDLQAPVTFEFGATLLNTNKGIVAQSLSEIGTALFNPLSFQMGTAGPEEYYQWQKDYVNSHQLDPQRYVKRPPQLAQGPRLSADDAIVQLIEGKMPGMNFIEGPVEAHALLLQWTQSDDFGQVHPENIGMIKEYLQAVFMLAQQFLQQQQMAQAAQQFQQQMGNKGQGQDAGGSGGGDIPPMQTDTPQQSEIAGGGTQGPPGSAH